MMSVETIQKILSCTGKSFDGMTEKDLSVERMCELKSKNRKQPAVIFGDLL